MHQPIADIRRDYKLQSLNEEDASPNPFNLFTKWWHEAVSSHIDEVNAMTLATADKFGKPHARIVLLKDYDDNGFVFFTNYNSQKGKEIDDNPFASLVFFWKELERQIRIEGTITKIEATKSDAYFQSRPAGSRIGAWASPQSQPIENRKIIENNFLHYEEKFGCENIPRPAHWGGYVVEPSVIEFWQGRTSRLHDRIRYTKQSDNHWEKERLAP
jgi:pyridoxamine 5'-phosphate oxidase